jgi:hypothetical protein
MISKPLCLSVFESSVNRPNHNLINRSAAEHLQKSKVFPVNLWNLNHYRTYLSKRRWGLWPPFYGDGFTWRCQRISLKVYQTLFHNSVWQVRMGGMSSSPTILILGPSLSKSNKPMLGWTILFHFRLSIWTINLKLYTWDLAAVLCLNGIAILLASIGITGSILIGWELRPGIRKV